MNNYSLRIMINRAYLVCILSLFFTPQSVLAQSEFKVVLDAGHGDTDPGNLGNKYQEKDIVLKITLAVGQLLEKDKSIKVIYTRKDDTFIELDVRGKIAHKNKADIFVSIHCDSYESSSPNGFGTFVLGLSGNSGNFRIAQKENSVIFLEDNYKEKYGGFDPNSPKSVIGLTLMQEEFLDQSLLLASLIQNNVIKNYKRNDREVRQENFLVLRETFMPSVLVETGFLTHKNEGAYLNSKKGQDEISKGIYKGIIAYKKQLMANTVVDIVPEEKPKKKSPKTRIIKGVDFKVQIASSKRKIKTESYNFKGLKGVERGKIDAHFKYYYGKSSDYIKIRELQTAAIQKGYTSSFIVAFKNGKKIKVEDALVVK